MDQIKSLNFEKSKKNLLLAKNSSHSSTSIDVHSDYINKLKHQILLEDGGHKEGGSESDSVIRRFREEMGSIDKSICLKSDISNNMRTPKASKEVPVLRKISSEVNVDERMM